MRADAPPDQFDRERTDTAAFIEAQRVIRERKGLPSSITDPTSLRLIAAVAAVRRQDAPHVA